MKELRVFYMVVSWQPRDKRLIQLFVNVLRMLKNKNRISKICKESQNNLIRIQIKMRLRKLLQGIKIQIMEDPSLTPIQKNNLPLKNNNLDHAKKIARDMTIILTIILRP